RRMAEGGVLFVRLEPSAAGMEQTCWIGTAELLPMTVNALITAGVVPISARTDCAAEWVMLLFLLYSALNGVTLSLLLLAYAGGAIAATFVATPGMFGRSRCSARRRRAVWPAPAVLLDGAHRVDARGDPRPLLAQRCAPAPRLRGRRHRLHRVD